MTLVATRIAVGFVCHYAENVKGALPSASILINITRLSVIVIGTLIVLQSLNVSITPILTALGVGGLAVALALQDTLSNLFAGLHVLASRQVHTGDYIRLDTGQEGYVTDITWRNTTTRALANNMIIVPNSKLASAIVTNFYQPEQPMSVTLQLGVCYGSELEKVEKVCKEVAHQVLREVKGGVADYEPTVNT